MHFVAWSDLRLPLDIPNPRARYTERANISSSSVRMTRTAARLASAEITPQSSQCTRPMLSIPRQRGLSTRACEDSRFLSPMARLKTCVFNPPMAAPNAPQRIYRLATKQRDDFRRPNLSGFLPGEISPARTNSFMNLGKKWGEHPIAPVGFKVQHVNNTTRMTPRSPNWRNNHRATVVAELEQKLDGIQLVESPGSRENILRLCFDWRVDIANLLGIRYQSAHLSVMNAL